LFSAHGKAKTLLSKLTAQMCSESYGRIQGSTGLTEQKILGSYNIAKLMKGQEEINWREFTTATFKFVDELNRLPPPIANSLFSLMEEGLAIIGPEKLEVPNFCLVASMNPQDSGTWETPTPLVDRFDICIPLKSPTLSEKLDIIRTQKRTIKPILKTGELERVWDDVENVKITRDIEVFVSAISKDLQLCVYGEKDQLVDFPQCCDDCFFKQNICSSIISHISERLYLSILKIGKALAYLNGRDSVKKNDILTILKYALYHRLRTTDVFAQKYHSREKVVEAVTEWLITKDLERSDAYKLIREIIEKGDEKNLEILKEYADKDLLLKEMYEEIKEQFDSRQKEMFTSLEDKSPLHLEQLRERIRTSDEYIPNTKAIIDRIDELLSPHLIVEKSLTKRQYLKFCANISKVSSYISRELRSNLLKTCDFKDHIMGINVINNNDKNFVITIKCRDLNIKGEVDKILREAR
jgi:MoxR-like ATPase